MVENAAHCGREKAFKGWRRGRAVREMLEKVRGACRGVNCAIGLEIARLKLLRDIIVLEGLGKGNEERMIDVDVRRKFLSLLRNLELQLSRS